MKMGDPKSYLSRLRKGLLKLSRSEQEDIVAEIQSHIQDGLQDQRLGVSQEERAEKTISELGRPREMVNGMNEVHRRHGWLDVILVLAIFPILIAPYPLKHLMDPQRYKELSLLAILVMLLGMVIIARKRGSSILEGWWLSWTAVYISLGPLRSILRRMYARQPYGNVTTITGVPTWMMITLLCMLLLGLSFLIRRIWLSRSNGFAIFFLLFPITSQCSGLFTTFAMRVANSAVRPNVVYLVLISAVVTVAIYTTTFARALATSRQSRRWYSLTIGMVALAIHNTAASLILFPNTSVIAFVGKLAVLPLGSLVPVIIGLAIEYRHTGRNPLIPVRG